MAGSFCETVLRSVGKYQTVKFAEIRSLRLGLLHYGLLFIIFVYIVVVQVREDTTNNSALLHTYTTLAFTFSSSSHAVAGRRRNCFFLPKTARLVEILDISDPFTELCFAFRSKTV